VFLFRILGKQLLLKAKNELKKKEEEDEDDLT